MAQGYSLHNCRGSERDGIIASVERKRHDGGGPTSYAVLGWCQKHGIGGRCWIFDARVDIGAFEFQGACDGPDFDDDEIPNVADRCDDTPLGIPVDSEGRPTADLNHDCTVGLLDFGIFQESMIGP